MDEWLVAVLVGVVQGALEWLPVSSEGTIALTLTIVADATPDAAVSYALFLHAGTAMAATVFYRDEIVDVLRTLPGLRPRSAFERPTADLAFLGVGTAVSGVVAISAYKLLEHLVSDLTGGAFVALIGGLLIVTGLVQRVAESRGGGLVQRVAESRGGGPDKERPTLFDAVLVGGLQGLAILPGVSRSGTTVSALLLRGYEGVDSLRLSFLLSIPAALGAGVLAVLDTGVAGISPGAAVVALAVSGVVGYLTVGALVALARRVAFWGICIGFGSLAVVGGALLVL
ncbi:undecaprenyl-diphosphate phosphatase [Halorientalis brevis]|uniref:Undecaprenyl-diphosphatase n=1 Tax=Halorientalis brevis TaxID=1126241 RepID=A0ABD6C6H4_9EURY|nr:undecaprenyl-diphosphate phosphatase [Halorientalis brevis]